MSQVTQARHNYVYIMSCNHNIAIYGHVLEFQGAGLFSVPVRAVSTTDIVSAPYFLQHMRLQWELFYEVLLCSWYPPFVVSSVRGILCSWSPPFVVSSVRGLLRSRSHGPSSAGPDSVVKLAKFGVLFQIVFTFPRLRCVAAGVVYIPYVVVFVYSIT